MSRVTTAAVAFLAAALSLGTAYAQSVAARITGTVTDPTRGAIPEATVTAVENTTGRKLSTVSAVDGQYVLYPLPPGIYTLTVEAKGLRPYRIQDLQLFANDTAVRNPVLEVGTLAQEVTISDSAIAVNASPSVEATVTEEQVRNLPLNGRDYNQLVLLGAGAVDPTVTNVSYDLGVVAVNGNRAYGNSYLMDGASNTSTWQNTSAIAVSVGLIREFKVISGVAPAEYGNGATSIVLVTKSGTNQFHGSLFEYYRGNTLITRDPFTFTQPAPFRRNQFGGSLGGPIKLPHYDGRNRTFFFVNYEALRQTGGATRVTTVPLDDFWKGDFSSLLPRVQLRDPLATGRPVIPGNRLDQYLGGSRINQVALNLRPLFAKPNVPGMVNNSVQAVDATSLNDQFSGRIDHSLSSNHQLSARFTYSNSRGYTPGAMGLPELGARNPTRAMNGMLGWTGTFGTSTVNELRLGVSSFARHLIYITGKNYPTGGSAGMLGLVPEDPTVSPTPILQFSGADAFSNVTYSASGGQSTADYANNVYTFSNVISTTRGRHQFKVGVDGRSTQLNYLLVNNGQGNVQFNGQNNNNSSGYSFADYLMGVVYTSAHSPAQAKILLVQPEFSFFAQDDWRIARNLTLTYGMRNETFYHPAEERNRLAMFTPDLNGGGIVVACGADGKIPTNEFNPGVMSRLTRADGTLSFPMACGSTIGYNSRRLVNNKPWNWGPRVGLAWDPTGSGRWMIHSGYGTFFSRYPQQYIGLTVNTNPPYASIFNYQQSLTNFVPALTLRSPYLASGSPNLTPYGIEKDFKLPDNQQWNFTIQRMLGQNSVFSIAYLGNKGTHLFRSVNMNMQTLDANGNIYRSLQNVFGGAVVSYEMTNANSTYHALQTEVRRRSSRGISYQVNWTWAKGIDDVGFNATTTMLDLQNLGRDRANSDYVRRHQINSNFTWELPFGKGKRLGGSMPGWLDRMAGGWRLSGIWRYSTGRYLTPSYTPPGSFASNNRPDVVYGVDANLPRGERTQARWFNAAAFAVPPTIDPETGKRRYGNAGRNIIVGPGLNRLDGSLNKSFKLKSEQRRVAFRLDMFNLANHPNWGNPATNISSVTGVAAIGSINGSMRQAQFAVEFQF